MRVLLLTILLALPASAASVALLGQPATPQSIIAAGASEISVINPNQRAEPGHCPPTAAQMAADRARRAGGRDLFRKLTDLPPANGYVAVYRQVNGCEAPIAVKYGLGG